MPSKKYADRIIEFISQGGYQPQAAAELALAMDIGEDELGDFHSACKALMRTGRVALGSTDAMMLAEPPSVVVGNFRANPRGFGFIILDTPNAHGDLYISREKTGGALTGDRVRANVSRRGKRDGRMQFDGRIVAIVERGQSQFVGELKRQGSKWLVVPDGNVLHIPIIVGDPSAKQAKPGDQVVVELTEYPTQQRAARGVIVKVLGKRGDPEVDIETAIEQYQLPREFPDEVLSDARQAMAKYDADQDFENREDLRKLTIITIDPPDARDFDDAISLTHNKNGTIELGIHIADVSHFVPSGGALDVEAHKRGNSTYLPNHVIPMLPEILSNGVCSLQQREVRFTKSAFITYSPRGVVKKARVANTVIRSAKRLTYIQAQHILDGQPGRTSAKVVALLHDMEKLARTIRSRRLKDGMLVLDLPDSALVHDDDGCVIDVVPTDSSYTHTMIEMFMVEANEVVARLLHATGVAYLRRVHEEPRDMGEGGLQRLLRVLGHDLPDNADRKDLQQLLDEVRGQSESFPVNLAILRSMCAAEYTPRTSGHYALASENYSHFTSPIRRYPDLTIHRLIDELLAGKLKSKKGRAASPSVEDLVTLGHHCGDRERKSESAERDVRLVRVLRLIEKGFLGDEFSGVVTGVANIGVFVQLDKFLVDGLILFDNMPDDWWHVDAKRGVVIGERSGKEIRIGDKLEVRVASVHLPTRRMDLTLADAPPPSGKKRRRRPGGDGTKKAPTNRKSAGKRKRPKTKARVNRKKKRR